MKKRLFAAMLAVIVLLFAAVIPAQAAGCKMTLEVDSTNAGLEPGAEIRLPIHCTENTGYCSAVLTVEWDTSALELTDVEFTDLAPNQGSAAVTNSGSYTMRVGNSLSTTNFEGTGTFVTLVFRVASGAKEGYYPVDITHTDILDTDLNDLDVAAYAGTVGLTGASAGGSGDMPDSPTTADDPGSGSSATESGSGSDSTEAVQPTGADQKPTEGVTAAGEDATAAVKDATASEAAANGADMTGLWIALAIAGAVILAGVVAFVVIKKGKKK